MANGYAKYGGLGGGGGGTLTSINGQTGPAITIAAGSGISVASSLNTITITNTGAMGTVTSVSVVSANGLAGTVATPTTTPAITLSTTITGLLQGNGTAISAYTGGNLTDVGTDGITVSGGTGAVIGSGTSIAQHVADTTHNGYLSSVDWNTFNGKQASGNYITALTGDVTATGPGSVAATLATVNSNIGTFASVTVNGKGLVTAAAALSGDATTSGSVLTLDTVNSNVGSFTNASITVNAKGLVTAASSGTAPVTTLAAVGASPNANAGIISGNTLNLEPFNSSFPGVVTASGGGTTNFLRADGTWAAPAGSGSVTSVAFTDGSTTPIYTITGSPITSSGTITETLATQSANVVFSGPTTGAAAQPTFRSLVLADLPAGTASMAYAQAYFGTAANWSTTSTSYVDPTFSGTAGFTVRQHSGLTVTAGGSNVAGITFTPSSASAVYLITASFPCFCSSNSGFNAQLTDGTTVINGTGIFQQTTTAANTLATTTLSGIYVPGTTSPVTVKVQLAIAAGGGTATIEGGGSTAGAGLGDALEWTVTQIPTNLIGGSLGIANFGSTPNAQGGSVSSSTLTLQPASGSFPGGVSTTTQTFAGSKTLGANVSDAITIGAASSTALHTINGGMQRTTRTITSNLTVDTTTTDYIILCNQSGAITITLPPPTNGRILIIKDISGTGHTNNITIARNASENIEGVAASFVYQVDWGSLTITSDGTNWFFI